MLRLTLICVCVSVVIWEMIVSPSAYKGLQEDVSGERACLHD